MDESPPRTKDEALLDVRYQIRLHFLHRRLYNRLRGGVALMSVAAGSAAIITALQKIPGAVFAMSVIVAVASAADLVAGWADRAARHGQWQREMSALLARTASMDLQAIDAALAVHDGDVDDEIDSLRLPAMNDNLRSNGREDWVRPETLLQRFVRAIA